MDRQPIPAKLNDSIDNVLKQNMTEDIITNLEKEKNNLIELRDLLQRLNFEETKFSQWFYVLDNSRNDATTGFNAEINTSNSHLSSKAMSQIRRIIKIIKDVAISGKETDSSNDNNVNLETSSSGHSAEEPEEPDSQWINQARNLQVILVAAGSACCHEDDSAGSYEDIYEDLLMAGYTMDEAFETVCGAYMYRRRSGETLSNLALFLKKKNDIDIARAQQRKEARHRKEAQRRKAALVNPMLGLEAQEDENVARDDPPGAPEDEDAAGEGATGNNARDNEEGEGATDTNNQAVDNQMQATSEAKTTQQPPDGRLVHRYPLRNRTKQVQNSDISSRLEAQEDQGAHKGATGINNQALENQTQAISEANATQPPLDGRLVHGYLLRNTRKQVQYSGISSPTRKSRKGTKHSEPTNSSTSHRRGPRLREKQPDIHANTESENTSVTNQEARNEDNRDEIEQNIAQATTQTDTESQRLQKTVTTADGNGTNTHEKSITDKENQGARNENNKDEVDKNIAQATAGLSKNATQTDTESQRLQQTLTTPVGNDTNTHEKNITDKENQGARNEDNRDEIDKNIAQATTEHSKNAGQAITQSQTVEQSVIEPDGMDTNKDGKNITDTEIQGPEWNVSSAGIDNDSEGEIDENQAARRIFFQQSEIHGVKLKKDLCRETLLFEAVEKWLEVKQYHCILTNPGDFINIQDVVDENIVEAVIKEFLLGVVVVPGHISAEIVTASLNGGGWKMSRESNIYEVHGATELECIHLELDTPVGLLQRRIWESPHLDVVVYHTRCFESERPVREWSIPEEIKKIKERSCELVDSLFEKIK